MSYSYKIVLTKNYYEAVLYYRPQKTRSDGYRINDDLVPEPEVEKDIYTRSNYYRAKNNLRRLIDCNFTSNHVFVTLTFSPGINDRRTCAKAFTDFIERLRYNRGNKEQRNRLRYLAVPERHQSGNWHIHFLANIIIPATSLQEIWGNGFIKINRIRQVQHCGAYISKYLDKDFAFNSPGERAFWTSRGLNRPMVFVGNDIRIKRRLEARNSVFQKIFTSEYRGKYKYMLESDQLFINTLNYALKTQSGNPLGKGDRVRREKIS